MMDFAIRFEARDPARNIWRAYSITGGQDLFGDWIVAKVDELMTLCDQLKTQITTTAVDRRRPFESVLYEALIPLRGEVA